MAKRVVIVGGGPAAMAAATHLSAFGPERLEVHVYQQGWRLGGKGASGRQADHHQRIEEHGLHVWGGFYENAFAWMRETYAALDRPASCPIRTVEQAFEPVDEVTWGEWVDGQPRPWRTRFPRMPGQPGDGVDVGGLTAWLRRLVGWSARVLRTRAKSRLEPIIPEALSLTMPW